MDGAWKKPLLVETQELDDDVGAMASSHDAESATLDANLTSAYKRMLSAKQSVSFGTPKSDTDSIRMSSAENGLGTPKSDFSSSRYSVSQFSNSNSRLSSASASRVSLREAAKSLVSQRKLTIHDEEVRLPHPDDVRESIRMIHAHSRRDLPNECDMTTDVVIQKKAYTLALSRDLLVWSTGRKQVGCIETDDIVGAAPISGKKDAFRVHFFRKGKGRGAKALLRRPSTMDVQARNEAIASGWITALQELVRWQARVPPATQMRKIRVVVNPHSGARRAPQIWENDVKPYFDLAGFDYHIDYTTYAGHAVDMGKDYSPEEGYEAIVFVSGDGTICEYMNGLLARPEDEWKEVVASTPISLISAGTQNAFGTGVGIPTTAAAVYCIIKRKLRPLDVITAIAEHQREVVHYSCCGLGWGVAADIAEESEKYRWMGTKRYAFLKIKRALFPRRHTGQIKYIPVLPEPTLRKYDDIKNEGADDQFDMEEGNIYDGLARLRSQSMVRPVAAVRSPASARRYKDEAWEVERGNFIVVGAVNAAPDGVYCHPSDGCLDLMIVRKGNFFQTLHLLWLYMLGKELQSKQLTYKKIKALVIEQDQPNGCLNMDGEVLHGPGPFRMEVVPSLFKVLSEK
ncbi:hypothetical protein SDRG_16830 [Saprolegnia diclina VS20]|uniref:DAGKc domain-containing protein n=1 Tax=Saprolegnia diclina (strain VS20) TaxID=1156394 RepID=T0R001_SAPDV|nr:hypothetical protein SDRG_16830 [Saprolegnia diclina VS20]EQC25308.1 hypothetical protein SDRG_16830 [Saprolegnia diclina VS20]|eukprot:XP_008621274.1 hypothetical protein SDRG_16830 [Saprolegnia diclina VS20]